MRGPGQQHPLFPCPLSLRHSQDGRQGQGWGELRDAGGRQEEQSRALVVNGKLVERIVLTPGSEDAVDEDDIK